MQLSACVHNAFDTSTYGFNLTGHGATHRSCGTHGMWLACFRDALNGLLGSGKQLCTYIAFSVCQSCHGQAQLAYTACASSTVVQCNNMRCADVMSFWSLVIQVCLKTGMPVCRYTLFIPLYPVGMLAEMSIMLSSLPYLESQKLHSVSLPNTFNFGFDYHLFIKVCSTMLVGIQTVLKSTSNA